jgi:hypothetical protein
VTALPNDMRSLAFLPRHRKRVARVALLVLASSCTLALSSCELPGQAKREPQAIAATTLTESSVKAYLETMNALGGADPARQADVFYEVEREYTKAPTTASTLRYAVALMTQGHPAANVTEGKRLLETLLATPERMTPEERVLAQVLLHDANAHLKLEAENRRLAATLDDRGRSQANSDKRVQTLADENTRLRRALAEAEQKLNAIKEIERSIIERSPTPPGNRGDANASETKGPSTSR